MKRQHYDETNQVNVVDCIVIDDQQHDVIGQICLTSTQRDCDTTTKRNEAKRMNAVHGRVNDEQRQVSSLNSKHFH
ncbi:hypothetical protein KIN20_010966 [Parelaphostrongylus tenuis]|uniref:Uncharacterized protein n=1 Tax=Parelaphostrongylus tenuis TaxID=148309 RepID=A0AAD5M8P2_PARTN|nr:hypothetical protein KIN20_010966 [Parelaphostrongylus tenuis]